MADDIQDQIKEKIAKTSRTNPIVRNNLPRFLSDGATRLDQFGNAINQGTAPKPYTANIFENKNNSIDNSAHNKTPIKSDTLEAASQARKKIAALKTKLHTSNKSPAPQSKPKSRGLER
jgi:hypothetical protein